MQARAERLHKYVCNADPFDHALRAIRLVQSMINKGPFVRFAWRIATDTRLNHHPAPPAVQNVFDWRGRRFQTDNPKLFLRVERQTINRLPDVDAALFTIRTYFMDIKGLQPGQLDKLRLAL
ncbi:MAG: heme-dependent oxidative N-demethylase subunit alpha family protein [Gammaproteobacteria bacterium]